MRFAWLSARRGGWRSMVVPGVALVLSAFLGFLMATAQGWDQQRATLYENTTITGQFTSVNGRQYTGLMLEDPWQLWDSGLLSSMQVYDSTHYWMPDEMPDFPNTAFGNKLRGEWVSKQPELVFLNGLEVSPRFIYRQVPNITWLEGWDESFLEDPSYYNTPQSTPMPCIASKTWMEEQGIRLGDDIKINSQKGGTITVFPVGSYAPWRARTKPSMCRSAVSACPLGRRRAHSKVQRHGTISPAVDLPSSPPMIWSISENIWPRRGTRFRVI